MDQSTECILFARDEFMKVLKYKLYPGIYQGIKSIWEESKRTVLPKLVYKDFQERLSRVRKWNQDIINAEYNRIIHKLDCEWLDDLIKKVFIINTQILAVTNGNPNNKIKVKIPKGDKFIYYCYKECARSFYENALVLEDRKESITRVQQSENLKKAYKLINMCIENTVRSLLPIESLVTDSMSSFHEDGEEIAPPPEELFKSFVPFTINHANTLEVNGSSQNNANNENNDSQNLEILLPKSNSSRNKKEDKEDEDNKKDKDDDKKESNHDNDSDYVIPEKEESEKKDSENEHVSSFKEMISEFISPDTLEPSETQIKELEQLTIDLNSEDSDNEHLRSSNGKIHETDNNQVPEINKKMIDKLDLDVSSTSENQLPILSMTRETEPKLPSLNDFDSRNFFSDNED